MKRSEAIRHIINVLRLTGNHYCDNGRDKTDANKILERLEDIGMLPPFQDKSYNELGEEFVTLTVDQARYVGVCEWEPEDD